MDKHYDPKATEAKFQAKYEKSDAFKADVNSDAAPYCLMMPPPNVTGNLHMGHAFTFSLQDFVIRYQRMKGKDTLWQPGTDHAGIATQMVVERLLDKEGKSRHDLGREKFLEKVWEWKDHSGGTIVNQLKRLGTSPDWSRERFTLDEGLSEAVKKVFVDLYNDNLIYRDKRLVNWDPKLHTAISDLEVEQKELESHLWHFKYPLTEDNSKHIIVATTRPETMLGDTAVAVHPDDERYQDLISKTVTLPLVGREIKIVADEYADPETGSGAVKITPAHDFNDFEVGKRHDLEMINILDLNAHLNENVPEAYQGMERFEARKKVVADLEELGLVDKIEPHTHTVPFGDRSGVVIEPWLTDQWYCDAETLAKPAIEAVETGKTTFHPKQWEKTYFEWMRNIQPWCISRQLWWGHQIPAWFGPDGHFFVAMSEEDAHVQATKHYGKKVDLRQDEDVLDTWFSSALWPFSTLGWPEKTLELDKYFPTDLLITGFDIIFFWVARMMMMSLHFMGDVPFKDVYIHALVRDEKGQKMSKSKGNIIDPLKVIDEYGTDALRFTLGIMAAQGRDIKLSMQRVEGYRNFATKIWNAARFCEMNECKLDKNFDPTKVTHPLNQWILSELKATEEKTSKGFETYFFNDASNALYQFVWGSFCDWYVEFMKTLLQDDQISEDVKAETRATAAFIIKNSLLLLHPLMPFITEEIAEQLDLMDGKMVCESAWPDLPKTLHNKKASEDMSWMVEMITALRNIRAEVNIPYSTKLDLHVKNASSASAERLKQYDSFLCKAGHLNAAQVANGKDIAGLEDVVREMTLVIPVTDVVNLDNEKDRLSKEIKKLEDDIVFHEKKLSNENFTSRAPAHIVEDHKVKKETSMIAKEKLQAAFERLAGL